MDLSPIQELEALRSELQDLLDAERARGVYRLPRAARADFESAQALVEHSGDGPGQGRSQRAALGVSTRAALGASTPAATSAPTRATLPGSQGGPSTEGRRGVSAAAQSGATPSAGPPSTPPPSPGPAAPEARSLKKGAGTRWGGSPTRPKRVVPVPQATPPQAAAPQGMGEDGPPPPEIPDWLAQEQEGQPPQGELPEKPRFKRPNKREIRYTWDHVVGSWGYRRRPLPVIQPGPSKQAAEALLRVRKEIGECERCGLCERSAHIVFGMGNPSADLLIVGEGPGEQEDKQGLPFIGPAGQMLDRMLLGVLGLDRQKVYILNIVKCRPPRNRDPKPEEIAECRPFLEAQIRAIAPKVILTLGSPAAQTLLNTSIGITKLRGSWHEWQGIPVRPTLHPAYLLRKPSEKGLAMEDLVALRERYQSLGGVR